MKFRLGKSVVICVALFSLFSWSLNASTLYMKNTPMSESLAFRDAENLQIGDKKVIEKMHRIAEQSENRKENPTKSQPVKRIQFTQMKNSIKKVENSTNYVISADKINMKLINILILTFFLLIL